MPRLMSVNDAKWHFYECLQAKDFENAASYFETVVLHYKRRGKQIKTLKEVQDI